MAPRIFISFAVEDVKYRTLFVAQAKNERTPFTLVDMSLQEPFDERWKTQCRKRIAQSHGFVALLSKKTWKAEGARWEMKCAHDERIPILGIHIHADNKGAVPPELTRHRIVDWRWSAIGAFIKRIDSKRSFLEKLLDFD